METKLNDAGTAPASGASRQPTTEPAPAEPVQYETAKGCLAFAILGLLILGLIVGVIVLLGEPPSVGG